MKNKIKNYVLKEINEKHKHHGWNICKPLRQDDNGDSVQTKWTAKDLK